MHKTFDPSKYVAADIRDYHFENKIAEWLQLKEALTTINKYKQYNRDYFIFFLGNDVCEIRATHIDDFYCGLPIHLSDKTKKNILSCLHSFFSWLHKKEKIEKIPVFPHIELDDPDWEWVDVGLQSDILLAIPERDRPLYLFPALHGARPSETRALKVKDVDFHLASIKIRRTFTGKSGNILQEFREEKDKRKRDKTKTGKIRVIPINQEMYTILETLCKNRFGEEFVFINPRTQKYYSKTTFQDIWQKACTKVSIKIKAYEGLRHSWASQRASRGVDLYLISKVLGHTDIRTTQRYSHTNLEALKNVMNVAALSPDYPQSKNDSKKSL